MKKTQLNFVKKQLLDTGRISRNDCLNQNITRLSAIILNLKEQGFETEGKFIKKDYIYELTKNPYKKVEYRVNGELVGFKYEKTI